jgi:hypothetical protein
MIQKSGQQQLDLGTVRNPGQIEPAANAEAFYKSEGGAGQDEIKPHSIQDRYAIYQHYKKDIARVDAGGSPSKELQDSYSSLRGEIPGQAQRARSVATPDFDESYMNDSTPYYPKGVDVRNDVAKGKLKVAPTTPGESTVAWDAETNNEFRFAHDVIAHAGAGVEFSGVGENQGGAAHISTLPESAHRAAAAELIGQNAYTEFEGKFVNQKGLYDVPDWTAKGARPADPPRMKGNPGEQLKLL